MEDSIISFLFTANEAVSTIGEQMQQSLTPMLERMNEIMRRRGDILSRIGFDVMTLMLETLSQFEPGPPVGEPVHVTNLDFLELMAAGSFAFLVLIFLKLEGCCRQQSGIVIQMAQINQKMLSLNLNIGEINFNTRGILNLTGNLNLTANFILRALVLFHTDVSPKLNLINQNILNLNGSLGGLHFTMNNILNVAGDISVKLSALIDAVLNLTGVVRAIGFALAGALAGLLAALLGGLALSGSLDINFNFNFSIAGLDLMTLAGLIILTGTAVLGLIAALTALAGFVLVLAVVLKNFGAGPVIKLIATLAALVAFLYLLKDAIRGFDPNAVVVVAFALGVLALFVIALGRALDGFGFGNVVGLVVSLAALALFVYFLGVALRGFNADVLAVIPALDMLFGILLNLANAILAFSVGQMVKIAVGLLGIVVFIGLLGVALSLFNADVLGALPGLAQLFDALIRLATAIASFSAGAMAQIAVGLFGIVVFMGMLGAALLLFNADVLAALPGLAVLLASLGALAVTIASFSIGDMARIAVGLFGIVVFMGMLGAVLLLFNADVLAALPGLAMLLMSLAVLAVVIASFSVDQMEQIAVGLLGIVVFMGMLGVALLLFNADVLAALPGLAMLFDSIIRLAFAIVSLSPDQLFMIGVAMAALTVFMFGMAVALAIATPGLLALAAALSSLESLFNSVAGAASRAWSVISSIPSISLPSVGDLLPSFQTGGVMPYTGAAMLHAGERVLTTAETAAYNAGAGGAAPAPAGGSSSVDQSVHIGAVNVNINAEKVDSSSGPAIGEKTVEAIEQYLRTRDFRMGTRTPAPV